MDNLVILLGTALVLALAYLLARYVGSAYWKYRGKRVITCPENERPAAVVIDAGHVLLSSASGRPRLRLSECSSWPEKANCGQECLRQIEASPQDCLVRNIFLKWYQEKSCTVCGKALGYSDWMQHQPTVMNLQRITLELRSIPPENLPDVLQTHQPVCWNCHIAETFRRQHPDLVVERTWKDSGKPVVR